MRLNWKRFIPALIIAVGCAMFFAFDLDRYITFETIKSNRDFLKNWVAHYPVFAPITFMVIYMALTAFSVPGGGVLTMTSGFLFGAYWGTLFVVFPATIGAVIVFSVAKTALGGGLRERVGPWLKRMEAGFKENALSYLLTLRMIVIFPFVVVNVVPAFLNVNLKTYIIGTFFGIIPATFIFTLVGAEVDRIFAMGQMPGLGDIFTPGIIFAFLGIITIALLPVVYKKYFKKNPSKKD